MALNKWWKRRLSIRLVAEMRPKWWKWDPATDKYLLQHIWNKHFFNLPFLKEENEEENLTDLVLGHRAIRRSKDMGNMCPRPTLLRWFQITQSRKGRLRCSSRHSPVIGFNCTIKRPSIRCPLYIALGLQLNQLVDTSIRHVFIHQVQNVCRHPSWEEFHVL